MCLLNLLSRATGQLNPRGVFLFRYVHPRITPLLFLHKKYTRHQSGWKWGENCYKWRSNTFAAFIIGSNICFELDITHLCVRLAAFRVLSRFHEMPARELNFDNSENLVAVFYYFYVWETKLIIICGFYLFPVSLSRSIESQQTRAWIARSVWAFCAVYRLLMICSCSSISRFFSIASRVLPAFVSELNGTR